MGVLVSTLARHSAATVVIVEPTPQPVHSTAAAEHAWCSAYSPSIVVFNFLMSWIPLDARRT